MELEKSYKVEGTVDPHYNERESLVLTQRNKRNLTRLKVLIYSKYNNPIC